jgi:hypothetical protein
VDILGAAAAARPKGWFRDISTAAGARPAADHPCRHDPIQQELTSLVAERCGIDEGAGTGKRQREVPG